MAHKHSIYDTDPHFTIDPVTRRIKNESGKVTLVQGDHNSERFTFEIPRYVDGHDMSLCDVVEVHYDNVDSNTKEKYSDVEEVKDLQLSPDSSDVVIFSWLISGNATQYRGALTFSIGFQCHDDEGNIDYELGTLICEGISVGERLRNSKTVVERVADILSKWRSDLFGIGKTEEAKMRAVSQEEQDAIVAKGADVLATIPADYKATTAMAEEALRTKAEGIVLSAEGKAIVVNDSSADYIRGLRVFGKSVQDGDPTPDNPHEIVSTEKPTIAVRGKNLIPFPYEDTTMTKNGITFTIQDDGSIRLSGTATNVSVFSVFQGSLPLDGVFTLSGVTNEVSPSTHYMQPYVDGVFKDAQINGGRTYDIHGNLTQIALYVKSGETVDGVVYPQLEIGDRATEYEQPKAQVVESPHTLHGIPVTSGGNYTDENGQQWVCDEIDFERGVYVERIKTIVLDGSHLLNRYVFNGAVGASIYDILDDTYHRASGFCTHSPVALASYDEAPCVWVGVGNSAIYWVGVLDALGLSDIDELATYIRNQYDAGTPVTIRYPTNLPIETQLSESEIAAFRALKTNKLTTTVLNDAGAHMQLDYVADTKTYIDNQITKRIAELNNNK